MENNLTDATSIARCINPAGDGQETNRILKAEIEKLSSLLHDDLLQAFGTCVLKAQLCQRLAQLGKYELVTEELAALEDSLNLAIDSVRHVVEVLRTPPVVQD